MKFVVGIIIGLGFLTAVQAQALLPTESASYKCQSSDLSYVGQITFSKASRYSEITMNVCEGGPDNEPTNCHEETSFYEEKDLTLQIVSLDHLLVQTQFPVIRFRDEIPPRYFTGNASFMDAGLGYEIGLLTPDRPGDYYRVFVRVFRGKPFKTPLIGRFEMICPVVK